MPAPKLWVRIGDDLYATTEWSFGGFLVEDPEGRLNGGALLRINGLAYGNGEEEPDVRAVDIRARVVRRLHDAKLAALTSHNLDGDAYKVLYEIRDRIADGKLPVK